MGVYSLNHINESSNYLDDVQEKEIYTEDFMEAGLQNVYENVCNFNSMMKSIGIAELAVYESTGEEIVYEAGTLSSLIDKLKSIFKKIWEKIKSLFTKFMAKMQSFGKDDKAFVTKYRKEILQGSVKDLNVKGFKFTLDAFTASDGWDKMEKDFDNKGKSNGGTTLNADTLLDDLKTFIDGAMNNSGDDGSGLDGDKAWGNKTESEVNDLLRGIALGKPSTEMDANEFQQELFEMLRNGDSKPQTLDDSDIKKGEMINFLMNSSTTERTMNKEQSNLKKTIDKIIRAFDKASIYAGKFNKDETKENITKRGYISSYLSRFSRVAQEGLNIAQVMCAARMKAFNDCRKQYKSICVKLIGRKAKNEGYEYEDEYDSSYNEQEYESILGDIKFI